MVNNFLSLLRCDALVSGVEGTQPKTSKSSYTVFTVSGRGQDIPDFSHMTIEESMSAIGKVCGIHVYYSSDLRNPCLPYVRFEESMSVIGQV